MDDEMDKIEEMHVDGLKILSVAWFDVKAPIPLKTIGIVTVRCDVSGKVKRYIGLTIGKNLIYDIVTIVTTGVPFNYPGVDIVPSTN